MIKTIKSYEKHGDNCGIAEQVQGKTVDAVKDDRGLWHFEFENNRWIASDYAFESANCT